MRDFLASLRLWLGTAVRAAPLLVTCQLAIVMAQAMTSPLQAYGVAALVDGVGAGDEETVGSGTAVLIVTLFVLLLAHSVEGVLESTVNDRVHGRVYADVLGVTTSIPGIEHHERVDAADRLTRLREDADAMGYSAAQLVFMGATVANTVTVLWLLVAVHPVLLVLPVLAIARVWAARVDGRLLQDAIEATTPRSRLVQRIADIARSPRHATEVRVFGLRSTLLDRMRRLQDDLAARQAAATRRGMTVQIVVRVLFGLAYAAAILFVIGRARAGQASVGDVTLVVLLAPSVDRAASGVAGNVREMVNVVAMFGRYRWLRRYAAEASWSGSTTAAPDQLRDGIALRDVGFGYPGAGTWSLRGVSLDLPAGSTVALVGENGAGKTTLVKLLARLYDPTEGVVSVDGQSLKDIDTVAWRSRCSAGFQDYCTYQFLAREAVGVGDVERIEDEAAVRTALAHGDGQTVVDGLPDGLENQLGRDFAGGADLSGGQWQRLALSRAFMRSEPLLLLLDEPTAALDPESEHALFERFARLSRESARCTGGITVLVSHRFSTVRMADLIVVLEAGRVVEVGTHEELVTGGGRYAELFELQARSYR